MACPVFSAAVSDLVASVDLAGSVTNFLALAEGTWAELEIDHSADGEFAMSEIRVVEVAGAVVTVDASRTTAGNAALLIMRVAGGGESGDLAIVGTRAGLLA